MTPERQDELLGKFALHFGTYNLSEVIEGIGKIPYRLQEETAKNLGIPLLELGELNMILFGDG